MLIGGLRNSHQGKLAIDCSDWDKNGLDHKYDFIVTSIREHIEQNSL
jgi:hypothetical protein